MQISQRQPGSTRSGPAFTSVGRPSALVGTKNSKFSPGKNQSIADPYEAQSGGRFSSVLVTEAGLPSPSLKVKSPAFKLVEGGEMPQPGDLKWSPERLEKLTKWPGFRPIRDKT
jgi:hypothetical protein